MTTTKKRLPFAGITLRRGAHVLACCGLLVFTASAAADWRDWLKAVTESDTVKAAASSAVPTEDIAGGLRAALDQGVRRAVAELGREGGYLDNARVRIPLPQHLNTVETALRSIGQDQLADEFVTSMNRAAERAVPEAASVFAETVSSMTIDDARQILDGPDTAATDYLRARSGEALSERFQPIVREAMNGAEVTRYYQQLVDKAGFAAALIDTEQLDLGRHVTDRSLDGLFKLIADEEQRIRSDPAARTSELLRRVFGAD